MRRFGFLALCTVTACSLAQAPPSAQSAESPSAEVSPGPPAQSSRSGAYGVFLKYAPNSVPVDPGPVEMISLVATDGRVAAQATPAPRSGNNPGPTAVSASNSAVYFLDGDTQIRALTPDGRTRSVTTVPGSASIGSAFSVSPDDRRIAVATIDYSVNPAKANLYVEDLVGHGNHSEIYAATLPSIPLGTPIFQPIGWHQGHIVLFLADGAAFTGYHLVDATNAGRLVTACPDGWSITGNVVPAGILCFRNIPDTNNQWDLAVESWNGDLKVVPNTPYGPYCTGLSPHGTLVACSGQPIIVHRVADGSAVPVFAGRVVLGWIDETHVLVAADNPAGLAVVDIAAGVAAPTTAKGSFVGTLPGGLD